MANLAFPQLSSGALVQYPFRRARTIGSTFNTFADGSMICSNLNSNQQTVWELSFTDLTVQDQTALQNHVAACQGPLKPFIFIDPADNMLSNSGDLTAAAWIADPLLSISSGAMDPIGGATAFSVVNRGEAHQQFTQQVMAPANFQYCFSLYACSPVATSLQLELSATSSNVQKFPIGSTWVRLVSPVQLSDTQTIFSVSIALPPGQTVVLWGPQLEPQSRPSRYRATSASGSVYQNAHLLSQSITFESHAPGLFSTAFSIETT